MGAAVRESTEIHPVDVPCFNPDTCLVNILRRSASHGQDILVRAPEGELVVLGQRKEYVAQIKDVAAFCRRPAHEFEVEVLKPADRRRPDASEPGRPVAELFWKAAFYISQGRLMEGCYRDDVVHLARWPNLSRVPLTPNAVRICAFLSRYPTSITLASRLLKVELSELYQIYSAARCSGFAHALNRKAEEPLLAPHRNQGILSLLLGKITGL